MLCSEQNCFMCPHCGHVQYAVDVVQGRKKDEVRGRCLQCKMWIPLQLPSIRKKLVYLDQSFLSDIYCSANDKGIEKRLLRNLQELKQLQRIFLVVSDIHSMETSAIPDKYAEKRTKLWQFQNTLANGNIAGNFYDIFTAQTRRMLAGHDDLDPFPFTDIGLHDPHRWQAGMIFFSTNSGLLRLNRAYVTPRDEINKQIRNTIDRQVENLPDCRGVRDCLNHVLELWRNDIQQGIDAYQQQCDLLLLMEQYIEALETGQATSIQVPQLPDDAPFRRIVADVIEGLDEITVLQRWSDLLKNNAIWICPSLRIRIAIEAELLWTWWQGDRSNPKKFNQNFGQSRQNDINHVSAFVPYVDALTTDRDMHNLCERKVVAEELARFPAKIFSKKNYNEFEAWLDTLLAAR